MNGSPGVRAPGESYTSDPLITLESKVQKIQLASR
jgi:hypothetical protein